MKKRLENQKIDSLINKDSKQNELELDPVAERVDSLNQKELDQLLASRSLNFDGFVFLEKRFDYVNLALGSFRGTKFTKSVLSYATFLKKSIDADKYDLDGTKIEDSDNSNLSFSFCRFRDLIIFRTNLSQIKLNNCFIEGGNFNSSTIDIAFNNELLTEGGEIKGVQVFKSTFKGTISDVKFTQNTFTGTDFSACTFTKAGFKGNTFSPFGADAQTSFNDCNFTDCSFDGDTFTKIKIGGSSNREMSGVKFKSVKLDGATIDTHFTNNCLFVDGLSRSSMQNVDFASSTFEATQFGNETSLNKMNCKGSVFSTSVFLRDVVFHNCDLTNAKFPTVTVLQDAGVRFISCIKAPYNS